MHQMIPILLDLATYVKYLVFLPFETHREFSVQLRTERVNVFIVVETFAL